MIVVSDTSAISNLLTIGQAHLLTEIFGNVLIPPAVEEELRRFHAILPQFLRVTSPQDATLLSRLCQELDKGEAQAICLARELKAARLLIDEKLGRDVALREGLSIIGLVGVLIAAKQKRLISSITPLLDRLEDEAGFYLASEIKTAALRAVGEDTSDQS